MTDFSDNLSVGAHNEPVLVFEATTYEEAEVVRATLDAAGIPALMQNPSVSAGAGIDENVSVLASNGVFVAPSDAEAARALLNAPPPTEAELIAEEEADPTTLEEAEARVKDA